MSILRFGPFALHTERFALTRDNEPVEIPAVPLEVLTLLLSKRGDLLTRTEMAQTVWPESDPADLTHRINMAVNRIRSTLGDDPANPTYIQTVIGKGYRFVAEVSEAEQDTGTELAVPAEVVEAPLAPVAQSNRSGWWMFSVAALILLLGLGFFGVRHRKTAQPLTLEFVRFTTNTNENRVTAAAISPDGRCVAFADADGVVLRGENDLAARRLQTPEARKIERLAWSPDGLHLLISSSAANEVHQLWMLSTTGGAPSLLREHASLGTISPDGSMIAFTPDAHSELWVAGAAGENPRRVFAGSPNDSFPVILWSADGKRLLLERHTAFQSDGHFHSPRTEDEIEGFHPAYLAVDVATGRIAATEDNIRMGAACLLAEGRMLFARAEETDYGASTSFWKVSVDPHTGVFVSAPEKVRYWEGMRLHTLSAASQNGKLAAVFSHGRPGIYVGSLDISGGRLNSVHLLVGGKGGPHGWTTDSRAVLFESNAVDLHRYHIYKQALTSHEPESLTVDQGGESLPRLTPDGHSILFQTKSNDATISIWHLDLAGGSPSLIHQGSQVEYRCPSMGKDCVLGIPQDSQHFSFWTLDPLRGKQKQLITIPASWKTHGDWDVSPDGSNVALVSQETSQPEIHLVELASGKTQEILLSFQYPVTAINWMANGEGWIVAASTSFGNELYYVNAKGTPKPLRETATYTWGVPSPDGSKLAFADLDVDSNVWLLPANP